LFRASGVGLYVGGQQCAAAVTAPPEDPHFEDQPLGLLKEKMP
jgi:hypothetical protein